MLRVLVTRPEPGAARTAKALEAMGHRPILLPLSETRPLPVDAGALPARIDAVAATSANALRLAPSALVARLAALACHAVGASTAEAARAAGFAHVEEGPGDAEALAARIGPGLAGKSLAYLCGRVRLSRFEERLAATGVRVAAVETYDTVEIEPSSESVTARLGGAGVDAVLLYSAKAAQAAGRLAARPELAPLLGPARVLALSGRVAAAFGPGADDRMRVAAAPTEEALLELLRRPD